MLPKKKVACDTLWGQYLGLGLCNTLNHPHLLDLSDLSWYMLFLTSYMFALLSCIAFSSNQYLHSWHHLPTQRTCQVYFAVFRRSPDKTSTRIVTCHIEYVVLSKSFDTQDLSLTLCMPPWSSSLSRLRPKETEIKKARRALTMGSRHG